MAAKQHSIFDPAIVIPAIGESFKKLNPVTLARNPVMFVTEVGAAITTVVLFEGHGDLLFLTQIALWLWFTVLFANFAEAMAEGRGKAQAKALRATRTQTFANRLTNGGDKTKHDSKSKKTPYFQNTDLSLSNACPVSSLGTINHFITGIRSFSAPAVVNAVRIAERRVPWSLNSQYVKITEVTKTEKSHAKTQRREGLRQSAFNTVGRTNILGKGIAIRISAPVKNPSSLCAFAALR